MLFNKPPSPDNELQEDVEVDNEEVPEDDMVEISGSEIEDDDIVEVSGSEIEDDDIVEVSGSNDEDTEDGPAMACTVLEYEKPVFVCAFSPNSFLVATGCEDEHAYIVDSDTKELVHTIKGHKDSVTCLAFSKNGKYLATGDMEGNIIVTDVDTHETVFDVNICADLQWMIWHDQSKFLLAGNVEGQVQLWLIPSGHSKLIHYSGTPTATASLSSDGKRIAVGYDDGCIRILDLKTSSVLKCINVTMGHPITALSFHQDQIMILTGSANGASKLVDCNNGEIASSFITGCTNSREGKHVETVQFCPTNTNYLVIAIDGGKILTFDLRYPNHMRNSIKCHATTIVWHPTKQYFYASCLDGTVKCFDLLSGECLTEYVGHTDHVLGLDIKNDGTFLMSVSDDHTARIFKCKE